MACDRTLSRTAFYVAALVFALAGCGSQTDEPAKLERAVYVDCAGAVSWFLGREERTIHYLIDPRNSDVQGLGLKNEWHSVCEDGCAEPVTFIGDRIRWQKGRQVNIIDRATGRHTIRGVDGFDFVGDFNCKKLDKVPSVPERRL